MPMELRSKASVALHKIGKTAVSAFPSCDAPEHAKTQGPRRIPRRGITGSSASQAIATPDAGPTVASMTGGSRALRQRPPAKTPQGEDSEESEQDQEKFWSILDVIDERRCNGKLEYLAKWKDIDPATGKRYEPSWVTKDSPNAKAIAAWNKKKEARKQKEKHQGRKKRARAQSRKPTAAASESEPVLATSQSSKRRQQSSAPESGEETRPAKKRKVDIAVEIGVDPNFNPSEYQTVASSQSSQGVSQQPSQEEGEEASEQSPQETSSQDISVSKSAGSQTRPKAGISQSTIPDSQELPDSYPSPSSPEDLLLRESSPTGKGAGAENSSTDRSQPDPVTPISLENSISEIPSRQPDSPAGGSEFDGLQETGDTLPGALLEVAPQQPERRDPASSSSGFLTQPDIDIGISSREYKETSPLREEEINLNRAEQNEVGTPGPTLDEHGIVVPASLPLYSAAASPLNSQPAQVVAPLGSCPATIRSQTQKTVGSVENETIPDTVQKRVEGNSPSRAASPCPVPADTHDRPSTPRPSTATDSSMDGSTSGATPRSAVDELMEFRNAFLAQEASLAPEAEHLQEQMVISPSSVLPTGSNEPPQDSSNTHGVLWSEPPAGINPRNLDMSSSNDTPLSTVDEIRRNMTLHFTGAAPPTTISPDMFEQIPTTVAPSDLTNAPANPLLMAPDAVASDNHHILSHDEEDHVEAILPAPEPDHYDPDAASEDQDSERPHGRYLVTLPMAANTRSEYISRISGENKLIMTEYSEFFTSLSQEPDEILETKMTDILQKLIDLCDLPAYVDDVSGMNPEGMMKHATGTNSKFSFIYEFLNAIRDISIQVLILCDPGRTVEYLEAVLSVGDFNYSNLDNDTANGSPNSGLFVRLAPPDLGLEHFQGIDVVVIFDHAARSCDISKAFSDGPEPLILSLVVTHSIEHINMQMDDGVRGAERTNALNLGVVKTKGLLRSPQGAPEPHEAAQIFANYLRAPESGCAWVAQSLPDDVFDLWTSSQAATQEQEQAESGISNRPTSRKRPLDDDEIGTPKRARILEDLNAPRRSTPVGMSDLLKSKLASVSTTTPGPTQLVEFPLHLVEAMAVKISELEKRVANERSLGRQSENHIKTLEASIKSHERSTRTIQTKYMEALRDRGTFEVKCNEALKEATAANKIKLETSALKEEKKALEVKLAVATEALTTSTNPEVAELARAKIAAAEAEAKVQSLEKKLASAENDLDYSRDAYQRASNQASELGDANKELTKEVDGLKRKASENFAKIHQINKSHELDLAYQQNDELQARLKEANNDLDRLREENRRLTTGRRETRQASVPRSPRPGVGMSPRVGGSSRVTGSASRGTSPAPVSGNETGQPAFPTGNGRWTHLRD
ncbi:hypothetical protein B0H66DRAFT_615857 [Apodospora peruviana]|uniref:Chromo domain-containing protein n=1 Tax=Apodospora peruviana TaxID=516989 RepID=A0AAE0IHT2_9PEZI|nr:hypothetical protein B0H66DRAFT_615857 [Apodospora peruviana]